MNTADYLLQAGDGDRIAVIAEGKQSYTYRDLRHNSARVLHELAAAGIRPGDRVGLLGGNTMAWIAAYLATIKFGAVAVLLPTTSTPEDTKRAKDFAGCRMVCLERRFQRRFASAFEEGSVLILDDVLEQPRPADWPDVTPECDVSKDAVLMLTSGTTARPRAVRITHRNIQANTESIIAYLELTCDDRIMAVLPFYYCFGTSLLHTHLRVGGSLVLSNSFAYPETVLDAMETTECTGFAGVPSTYQTLLRNSSFPRRPLKALRKVQQAGGKLPTVLIKELVAAVPQARVYVMYGQTEATARLSYLPPSLLDSKLGSIGKGIPGVVLEVIGESGLPVQPGEVGEIYARGDNISPGYLEDPEENAQKFVNGTLRSGDLATVDEDGFIYIVDRKADFIKSYGHRVSSQEIEARILELPDVVAAAAIGEPDLVQGEAIKVYVTLRSGSQLTPEDIITHCRERMVHHMIPKAIIIVDSLPMSSQGKILKSELRKLAQSSAEAPRL